MSFWQNVLGFLEGVEHELLPQVAPVVAQAVSNLATEEVADLTTPGGTANTGKTLAKVVDNAGTQLAQIGLQVALPTLLAGVGQAIAQLPASQPAAAQPATGQAPA